MDAYSPNMSVYVNVTLFLENRQSPTQNGIAQNCITYEWIHTQTVPDPMSCSPDALSDNS
jgi:hypothetical protein